jgi:signal transduction histidine kinase
VELERRVAHRTADLEKSRAKLSKLLIKLITAQEEERKRIARELHDDTSQTLNATLLSLDFLNVLQSGDEALREKLGNIREQVLSILKGVHRMIKDLRPPVLDDFGLESAVRWVLETHLAAKGVNVYFDSGGGCADIKKSAGRNFDCKKVEFMLFRVIQEAIINIDRHAAARNVFLTVIVRGEGIEVEVDDDGVGFDMGILSDIPGSERESGFGIAGMRERVSLLDGTFTIHSKPGQGTYINVFVPLPGAGGEGVFGG